MAIETGLFDRDDIFSNRNRYETTKRTSSKPSTSGFFTDERQIRRIMEKIDSLEKKLTKGWECPNCGLIHSPNVQYCSCKNPLRVVI